MEEGSRDGHLSLQGPYWGAWKGARLPGDLCVKESSGDGHLSP